MTPDDPRRLGVFWIGERDLMALLGSAKGTTFTVQHNLPGGFKVESVHYDMVTRSWAVTVAHESLPAVDDGSRCAWVDQLQLQTHPAPVPPDVIKRLGEIRDQLIADAESVVGEDATWPEGWPCEPVIVEDT